MTSEEAISVFKKPVTADRPRRQSGMDRVVEKTRWQKVRKPVSWGGVTILLVVLFVVFGPEKGRALKVQNDRLTVSTTSI